MCLFVELLAVMKHYMQAYSLMCRTSQTLPVEKRTLASSALLHYFVRIFEGRIKYPTMKIVPMPS
jgi:hypothetical protein